MMSFELFPVEDRVHASRANVGYKALWLAVIIEAAFVALLIWKSTGQTPPPAAMNAPVTISLVTPSPPKPLPPIPKPKVQPQPRPQPRPVPQPRPLSHPVTKQPKQVSVPPSPLPSPVQAPVPKTVVTSPPPPSAAPVSPAVREDYLAQVKGAIQAAVHFPEAAKMLGENGRVLLRFTLYDGQISAVKILQKGGMSAFDAEAVAALHNARLPVVPAGLKSKYFDLNVWVEFRLRDQSE